MTTNIQGWNVLTHDYRSPLQGGDAIWDGTPGHELPVVDLDTTQRECSYGWNYTTKPETALRIVGLWPNGHPSRLTLVEPVGVSVERGNKNRAESLLLIREANDDEWLNALNSLHQPFGEHRDQIVNDVQLWQTALSRPRRNVRQIERGLRTALRMRNLSHWKTQRYTTPRDAWDARNARNAWDARDAWDAWNAWNARNARDALTVQYAGLRGWVDSDPYSLTVGVRDAYEAGASLILPMGNNVLGWVMSP